MCPGRGPQCALEGGPQCALGGGLSVPWEGAPPSTPGIMVNTGCGYRTGKPPRPPQYKVSTVPAGPRLLTQGQDQVDNDLDYTSL